jgi:hypothetical protein
MQSKNRSHHYSVSGIIRLWAVWYDQCKSQEQEIYIKLHVNVIQYKGFNMIFINQIII